MNTTTRWLFALPLVGALLGSLAAGKDGGALRTTGHRPELAYMEAVNRAGPPQDPQVLLVLMGQYANANRHRDGIAFFSTLVKEFEPRLSDQQKALYLGAIGVLRAGHAHDVPLWKRTGWVRDTIEILEEAKRVSGGQVFVVRWMSGVVSAQLPSRFHQREAALADLTWCIEHVEQAPHAGWLREVYYQLATLSHQDGYTARAQEYLRLSGYADFEKPITLTTPFTEDLATGHTFSPKRVAEVVPGKVYALSGYEFTEYYFVVSDDGRELIGIDAGTRPDAAQAAYEALRAYAPQLPELTTVLITHAHWDHVGEHTYFRALNPHLKFYARANYHEEVARELNAPGVFLKRFFGSRFRVEEVQSFTPDITIDRHTELRIGGTRLELIPVQGGETHDALFIHLPDHGVMFVGDFIMPYLGAPFVEEGNLPGLLEAIDLVVQKHPRHLLHGHEPLTRLFASPAMLAQLKTALAWLREEVLAAIRQGAERAAIQQANLIPPGLLAGNPDAHLPYLVMREHVINRLYDQHVGHWQPDLQGVNSLSHADRGSILIDYLGMSERQLVKGTERMIADGKYELAATTLAWTKDRFAGSKSLREVERLTYLKLMDSTLAILSRQEGRMSLTIDELSQRSCYRGRTSSATPARGDHPGIRPVGTTLFGACLVACPGLTSGGNTHARGSHRDRGLTGDGAGRRVPRHELPSCVAPRHVVGLPGQSDAAWIAHQVAGASSRHHRAWGRRHCGTAPRPQDRGQRLLPGCRPFHEEAWDSLLRLEGGGNEAPGPGALEPASLGMAVSHCLVLAGGEV